MENTDRITRLLDFLHTGFVRVSNHRTGASLGDRERYVGASDIVQGYGCFRKSVLDKIIPVQNRALNELLTLERGHWQEQGILEALISAGACVLHQLEIAFDSPGATPCRFHLDLVLVSEEKTTILESKSFREKPGNAPRDSHDLQIRLQTEALHRFWDQPCFRLSNSSSNELRTFPDLIAACFAENRKVSLRREVEGWLICVGADVARPYDPYQPTGDDVFWSEAMGMADSIMGQVRARNVGRLTYARGVYPLCEYCSHFTLCPKFRGEPVEMLAPLVREYIQAKRIRVQAEKEEEELKASLQAQYGLFAAQLEKGHRYLETSAGKFAVMQSTRTSYKRDELVRAMEEAGIAKDTMDRVLMDAAVVSEFSRLAFYEAKGTQQPVASNDAQTA